MLRSSSSSLRGSFVLAAGCVIACIGPVSLAQLTIDPQEPAASAPASPEATAQQTGSVPPAQEPVPHYTGHPSEASAGGRERDLPDHAGIFPHGPVSLVVDPVKDLEKWLSANARLDLAFRAAFFFQQASGGPGERTAASQDYRVYGTWHMWNWEEDKKGSAGNLYFRLEYRGEMFTKITPSQLNTQIGALAPTTYGQDEHDFALVQLFYEQFLADGDLRLRFGKIDPDDYFNLGRWADDYRYFDHTLFSAFPASNHPSGGLGFNGQWYISPEWTLTGGFSDVQGRKTESGFSTVDEGKFLYAVDMTFSPTFEGLGKGNYRVGIEYRDAVEDKGRPSDTSFYINIDQEIKKDFAPFLRWGHGTGRSTGVEDAFAVGLGIDNCFNRPGDAFGWGAGFDTPDDSVVSERDIEYVTEMFYRFQLTHAMQYTIGGQLIIDPINGPPSDSDVVGILEMRLVIDF